jgi:SAM-dependent methyltransferase
MDCFGTSYAELYDALYADKDYAGECQFLREVFERYANPSVHSLLDFGCGTGNHALPLASAGFQVVGVDRSAAMLERAQAKAKQRRADVKLSEHFPAVGNFDAILCLFAVVNYLPSRGAVVELLRTFCERLSPGGVVVIEGWNGTAVPFLSESHKVKKISLGDKTWRRETKTKLHWREQHVDVQFECFEEPSPEPAFREVHPMRYYTPVETSGMVDEAGLDVLQVLPAYRWAEAQKDDFNLITLCKRKGDPRV